MKEPGSRRVERIAPYVQGEALVLSQGPYTFSLHRVLRGAGGEVWWLYDETKRPDYWAGTIAVVYEEGGVLDIGIEGEENPIMPGARVVVTLTATVELAAIRAYLERLFLLLGINGDVQIYDSARLLGGLRA